MRARHHVGAAAPGQVTPTSDKADAANVGQVGGVREAISLDSADTETDRKAFATMKANAALVGCSLSELADGGYLVSRWNYSKAVPCLRSVDDLLHRIGGRHG